MDLRRDSKSKSIHLNLLPKAATITFQNPSNVKRRLEKYYPNKLKTIVPSEAPWKPEINYWSFEAHDQEEPSSPKLSCIGQIQNKHKHNHKNKVEAHKQVVSMPKYVKIKKIFTTWNVFGRKCIIRKSPLVVLDRAPTLSLMKRFASCRSYYCNDEGEMKEEEEEEEEVTVPILGARWVGGGGEVAFEPRKEVNIWKRRTMPQPRPLLID